MASTYQATSQTPQPNIAAGNVGYIRPELANYMPVYIQIRDCIAGARRVKSQTVKYLPSPSGIDWSAEAQARYTSYLCRAVYVNYTKRTVMGLMGQIYLRAPQVEMPDDMNVLNDDASGTGVSLTAVGARASALAVSYGRCGMFVDYPQTDVPTTKADVKAGKIRPSILVYDPIEVINWRTDKIDGKDMLVLVVIQEWITDTDDGFQQTFKAQWRVLQLVNKVYIQTVFQLDTVSDQNPQVNMKFKVVNQFTPHKGDGTTFDYIPFTFIGAQTNDTGVNDAPMYDISELNLAHYRNSADWEEFLFISGQPTLTAAGLTQQWLDDVLDGELKMGSRSGIPLPPGAEAKILQVENETQHERAMDRKEKQMVAIGAKLIEQKSVQITATEANLDTVAEMSVLASIARNVSAAMKFALMACADFLNVANDAISYSLNEEFDLTQLDFNERAEIVKEWDNGCISWSEMRAALRRAGIATQNDQDAIAEIRKYADLRPQIQNQLLKQNVTPPSPQMGGSPASGAGPAQG